MPVYVQNPDPRSLAERPADDCSRRTRAWARSNSWSGTWTR